MAQRKRKATRRKPRAPTYIDLAVDIEAVAAELQKLSKALAKIARRV